MNHSTALFLLSAKQAEIKALQQLSANCLLVTSMSELVHQLQRERGISNIFLASGCELFAKQRQQQLLQSTKAEQQLRTQLTQHYLQAAEPCHSSRLLSGVCLALQGMDHLAELREQVGKQKLTPLQSTEAYSRLIAAWLAVVLESADLACDAGITRFLVALFNLLQTKEYAGQERAWGAMGLASGQLTTELAERLLLLQQAQQHSAAVFLEFATVGQQQEWQLQEQASAAKQLQQLRTMIQQLSGTETPVPALSDLWYQFATERIDAMHLLQAGLTTELQQLTSATVEAALQQLQQHQEKLTELTELPANAGLTLLIDPSMPGLYGASVLLGSLAEQNVQVPGRSFYQLLSEQAQHIRQMQTELTDARRAITEQKLIDRAKLLLMQYKKLTEEQAYRQLQQSAMKQQCRIADVAGAVIKALVPVKT
ncbi:MAG: nitrate- and nitrite sensing domain-containing protein [Gammaproteobacteria bacterium]|nr:nitrate- and nitrite sensing domain-containing protein [Gammaproteobacteria bacterium]MBU2059358.1 nitrate- and nitrite sensing domain-containing protein [Gammaproteobacteria bacterium]MBU2175262.1 nitrate- and nitrite sensing domain-containing protein [Gammaproteobacteria bacterium]MBU2247470.1 nitrate- and nitrite sensing domain-containing protein [Gammaproteobacteria bacterium]MBU2346263.1 nitrate- and nitrite sensing domain-containing protein [Gammaproteobacteria bacterium]